jgi:hypothetical protein
MENTTAKKIKTKKGDVIVINPATTDKNVSEAVLTIAQRRRRALSLKKRQPRLQMQRMLALRRFASELALKRRSRDLARNIMRARLASSKGKSYDKLTPPEKMMVDKLIQGREKTISSIAKRVAQPVRRSEAERVTRVRANLPTKRKKLPIMAQVETPNINSLFEQKLKKQAILYQAGKQDITPGKVTTHKEKLFQAVDETLMNKMFNALNEDTQVKAHLRAATLAQMRGQYKKAAIHRKIASALQRKDLTSARAMMVQLRTVTE